MFAPETATFVESGSALLVGTVAADGLPHASRGWGATVLDRDEGVLRLLLDADDATGLANIAATGAIAVTATSVPTLRSLQCKGSASDVEPATEFDAQRSEQYCDQFFSDIEQADGIPRRFTERIVPDALVACTVRVREMFDQTPGPGAGARVSDAQ